MTDILPRVARQLGVIETTCLELTDLLVGESGKVREEVSLIGEDGRDELLDRLDEAQASLTWMNLRIARLTLITKETK